MHAPRSVRTTVTLASIVGLLLLLSACGSSSKATATLPAPAATVALAAATATTAPVVSPTTAAATATTAAPTATTAASPSAAQLTGTLTVFAAASLTESFTTIGTQLMAANPGLKITFNFAGSQALVTQLTQGAKADVFASANTTQMTAAQTGGVIDGDATTFVKNKLAIVVPKDNPAGITSIADLAKPGIKLVVGNKDVPVGTYFLQILDKVSADATLGPSVKDAITANVVSQESDVKQVVAKVQLGEADAGIVYTTDVTKDVLPDVQLIVIPDQYNVIATYPIAAVKGGNSALAHAFINYILSPAGQQVLADAGFAPPR